MTPPPSSPVDTSVGTPDSLPSLIDSISELGEMADVVEPFDLVAEDIGHQEKDATNANAPVQQQQQQQPNSNQGRLLFQLSYIL